MIENFLYHVVYSSVIHDLVIIIFDRYYWNSMVQDIDNFVKSCLMCQRVNKKLHRTPAALHPISVDSPWYRIGIDLIGPLPITAAGMFAN